MGGKASTLGLQTKGAFSDSSMIKQSSAAVWALMKVIRAEASGLKIKALDADASSSYQRQHDKLAMASHLFFWQDSGVIGEGGKGGSKVQACTMPHLIRICHSQLLL